MFYSSTESDDESPVCYYSTMACRDFFGFGRRKNATVLTCFVIECQISDFSRPKVYKMVWFSYNRAFRKHRKDFIIYIVSFAFFHPHFIICIIRILSSTFYHPHFVIHILSSAFYHDHPHFIIRNSEQATDY